MLAYVLFRKLTLAALPFAPIAPPFAAGHAELAWSEPSNVIVGPPEKSTDGQPRRPLCHVALYGFSSTTENFFAGSGPFIACALAEIAMPPADAPDTANRSTGAKNDGDVPDTSTCTWL